jgi:hypothetical protein
MPSGIGQQIASLPYSLFATHYWLPGFSLFVAGLPSAILREQLPAHRIEPGLLIVAERIVNRAGRPGGGCDSLDCRPNATRQGQKRLPT